MIDLHYDQHLACSVLDLFQLEDQEEWHFIKGSKTFQSSMNFRGSLITHLLLRVQVVTLPSFEKVFEVPKPKTLYLEFSPKGSILCTWEQYTGSKDSQELPNMFVYDIKSKKCLRSFVQKKQSSWQPQWSDDESICARSMNNEVHIYESNNFETFCHKIHLQKLAEFSLAPGDKPHHIACHVPGTKGQPSFVRAFRHPNYEGPSAGIANKSFYKADKVEFYWNKKGTGLLLLTSTDVDKTGASYYGDQGLHFLRTNGDTAMVKRGKFSNIRHIAVFSSKDGPVYSVEWSPECDHFCVVYGSSKQVYRPPGARGQPSSFKVKDDESSSTNKTADSTPKSKTQIKNQKRKEAKKAKKENAQARK
ncbi:hypothetical protein HPB50_004705 [Hyalomma asiaticum]|uniref:Uncharacterized protein n=1 Tax=Hyalomma asiaticum TaxID=266040 RepID=A0ACB7STC8_HYAAI|nr:hypothetical protein HPB50_004705 [Hyalomma asiaticum]